MQKRYRGRSRSPLETRNRFELFGNTEDTPPDPKSHHARSAERNLKCKRGAKPYRSKSSGDDNPESS